MKGGREGEQKEGERKGDWDAEPAGRHVPEASHWQKSDLLLSLSLSFS